MSFRSLVPLIALATAVFIAGLPPTTRAQAAPLPVSQLPLFTASPVPPLNMLVMGKEHKNYYEAYNDASDLNGDGQLDVGYKPDAIDYFGYFNSRVCYNWDATDNRFEPANAAGGTNGKQCSGQWSGDFLNYLTTSRMDALRKVLYGGFRAQDTATDTTLQGAFLPQDAHSWGKEYRGRDIEGYDIALYAPLSEPLFDGIHLFAVTTTTGNDRTFAAGYEAPLFRVMQNSPFRVWNWLSIEGPVAGNSCFNTINRRVPCLAGGLLPPHPGHPTSRDHITTGFDLMEATFATPPNQYGADVLRNRIRCPDRDWADPGQPVPPGANCNPRTPDPDNDYLSIHTGTFQINATHGAGTYQFRINGDAAIDLEIRVSDQNGAIVAQAGCYGPFSFGACGGGELTPEVTLAAGQIYWFKLRHEDTTGGDGYQLEVRKISGPPTGNGAAFDWRPLETNTNNPSNNFTSRGNNAITSRFYNLRPTQTLATRQDYRVRVQVCPSGASAAALREDTCKEYPNGTWKPTGLLHDFGEPGRMYFGLITGSQRNNLEGGVLRRNISDFASEVNPDTGQFRTNVDGIARTLDRFRMIGGGYGGQAANFDNLTNDVNWAWGAGTGNCPNIGDRPINNGECRMWGNPIGEMMYESLRYFAGAATPLTRFSTGGATQGGTEETTMGLTTETWRDPYGSLATGGLAYPECAVPVQTVISDINPSYDSDLPGSPFTGAVTSVNNTPATITGFDMATVGQEIWNLEFGAGARNVFIGDSNNTADNAPTVKSVSSLGNIRGLSPEEPTKQGSYSSAAVARFGYRTDIHPVSDRQNLRTFSVALSSPLPRIDVPIPGGRVVTLIPFGLTVSGTFGGAARKPVNTIVDFYVEDILNFPGQPFDATVNGGRPIAVFRINYEDVEQGNDHDMDAIVRYQVALNADNTVTVSLVSEFAAGSANQNLGYIVSGTTRDGPYLEVRDRDSGQATSVFRLNTPAGVWAGECDVATPPAACNTGLTFDSTRTFTPAATGTTALQLKDPLWFAAKYGGFKDSNNNGDPDIVSEWDADLDGVPDNYFLVTNALNLREQLGRAFLAIERLAQPSGGINVSGVRVDAGSLSYIPRYTLGEWSGDLQAFQIRGDGSLGPSQWRASQRLPAPAARNLIAAVTPGPATGVPLPPIAGATNLSTALFTEAGLGVNAASLLGITPTELSVDYAGRSIGDIIAYLRGDGTYEADENGTPGQPFRPRPSTKIGDIISSEPELFDPRADFGYSIVNPAITGTGSAYRDFLNVKKNATPTIFVGANAGILHAFDARGTATGGTELFGFIPNSSLRAMGRLVNQNYVHRYYVDGSTRVGDAYLNGSWRTVLVGSVGAGGRSVFALDISNPSNFGTGNVLWELNEALDPDMGTAIGRPSIALLPGNRWVAIFGNGVNSATNRAMLFVVDLASGAVLRKIDTGFGSSSEANGMTNVVVTDVNRDGVADTVYGGDFQGNVWKFDLSSNVTTSWNSAYLAGATPRPLFVARDPSGVRQPITGSLNVSSGPLPGTQLVFFGTGSYFLVNDNVVPASPQIQSIYSIYDNGSPVPAPVSGRTTALVQQRIVSQQGTGASQSRTTTTNPVDFTTRRGWFMDLAVQATAGGPYTALGERFLGRPLVSAGRVFFPTFRPTGGVCRPGGENWLLGLNALSGANELSSVEIGTTNGANPCVGGNCGGVFLIQGPPVKSLAVVIPQPTCIPGLDCTPPPPSCDPNDPACVPALAPVAPSRCSLVVVPPAELVSGIVLPRPCGRVSWRQIQ
jgi:type IV pilus assembly protein PilY1